MRPNHSRTGPSQYLVDGIVYGISKSVSQRLDCFPAVFLLCGPISRLIEIRLPLRQPSHDVVEGRRFAEKHLLHLGIIIPQRL